MRRVRRFRVMLLAACVGLGIAHAQDRSSPPLATLANTQEPASAQVVSTPGGDAIITQINMGPFATAFWRKLQMLADSTDGLENFQKLVELFDLKLSEPLDVVNPKLPKVQWRSDITDKTGFIESGDFSVSISSRELKNFKRGLVIRFNQNLICLTAPELARYFGKTPLIFAQATHQKIFPNSVYENPVGYPHSMLYERPDKGVKIYFRISPSGCAKEFSITKDFDK